jgi:hypothetical protein
MTLFASYPVSSRSSRIAACSADSPSSISPRRYKVMVLYGCAQVNTHLRAALYVSSVRYNGKGNELKDHTNDELSDWRSVLFDDNCRNWECICLGLEYSKNGHSYQTEQ